MDHRIRCTTCFDRSALVRFLRILSVFFLAVGIQPGVIAGKGSGDATSCPSSSFLTSCSGTFDVSLMHIRRLQESERDFDSDTEADGSSVSAASSHADRDTDDEALSCISSGDEPLFEHVSAEYVDRIGRLIPGIYKNLFKYAECLSILEERGIVRERDTQLDFSAGAIKFVRKYQDLLKLAVVLGVGQMHGICSEYVSIPQAQLVFGKCVKCSRLRDSSTVLRCERCGAFVIQLRMPPRAYSSGEIESLKKLFSDCVACNRELCGYIKVMSGYVGLP